MEEEEDHNSLFWITVECEQVWRFWRFCVGPCVCAAFGR